MESEGGKGEEGNPRVGGSSDILRKNTYCRDTALRPNSEVGKRKFAGFVFVLVRVCKVKQVRLLPFNFFDFENSLK